MNTTKILSIVILVIALALGYYLFSSIKTDIDTTERIAKTEARVINKLKMIREAQVAFQKVNGKYSGNWDELLAFVDTGSFYITNKTEIIIPLDYGADSIYVEIDTIGTVLVKDSIFSPSKFPNFDLATLPLIPGTDGKRFDMWADKIDKAGVMVDVVEVRDIAPVDPARKESNEITNRKPLRFGSRTNITTSGNWE
ncbi:MULTISPECIES: hypothetical protein [Imperialibacter]|jgi:hypothetical protein|uniref:Uncharacterized protein n=1 Tax=Imperialibacter roseus TaxID=1324217 RepID=A0ABZ0IH42_9BACT|nr:MULTISPECIES: hypothetical protein [Imperialibacter]WOK04337.1 hypothetical protein RT717_14755 [Imperialibacter roseus]CAD5280839.1 conserved hypothetical protein [Imperialibacter sp. 75]CAD5284282.1 conserved hypothetical protein [Imperialibacter sp. 89]VVT28477.1 conserved hypothetical protein [Imperialibacter sp. EC-SDR9]|tara:strand:+ start:558 stop:1148 length:591 start_codon:yes stop_codon:yes gene_type:complete